MNAGLGDPPESEVSAAGGKPSSQLKVPKWVAGCTGSEAPIPRAILAEAHPLPGIPPSIQASSLSSMRSGCWLSSHTASACWP